jgi:hypothetical protein
MVKRSERQIQPTRATAEPLSSPQTEGPETLGFVVGGNGAVQTTARPAVEKTRTPKKPKKRASSSKARCRNLRMCGSVRVPKVTRSPHKFNAAERTEMGAAGAAKAVRQAFEAARLARSERLLGYKKNLPAVFQKVAFAMIKSFRGKRFVSARGAGIWLIARGLHEPVRYYHGFGGALGAEGLKLPWFIVEGVRYFDLGCVNMTEIQKGLRHAQISGFGMDMRPALIAG